MFCQKAKFLLKKFDFLFNIVSILDNRLTLCRYYGRRIWKLKNLEQG